MRHSQFLTVSDGRPNSNSNGENPRWFTAIHARGRDRVTHLGDTAEAVRWLPILEGLGPIAQGIEQRFPKPCVASSNLAGVAICPEREILLLTSTNAGPQGPAAVITKQHKWSLVVEISHDVRSARAPGRSGGCDGQARLRLREAAAVEAVPGQLRGSGSPAARGADVHDWHANLLRSTKDRPKAKAYAVLRTIMSAAALDRDS